MPSSLDLNYLKVFHEVARCGSFTEAARSLNISQSALSRSVALLEDSTGALLLERSKRGVSLTPVGKEVFARCDQLFQSAREIESICRGTRENCEGLLEVATTDHIANELLADSLVAFRRRFPLVIPSIVTDTPDHIANAVLKEESEIGLAFVKVPLPQLVHQRLRDEQMALICAPDLWRKHKDSSTEKTLKAVLNEVGYIASIGATLQSRPSRVLKELFGEMPKISIEANGQQSQKIFCIKGGGVAYLSRFMVESELRSGSLFEIPIADPHTFHMWLVTRKGHPLTLNARIFLQHLKDLGIAPLY